MSLWDVCDRLPPGSPTETRFCEVVIFFSNQKPRKKCKKKLISIVLSCWFYIDLKVTQFRIDIGKVYILFYFPPIKYVYNFIIPKIIGDKKIRNNNERESCIDANIIKYSSYILYTYVLPILSKHCTPHPHKTIGKQ